jgi:hypothetical protein
MDARIPDQYSWRDNTMITQCSDKESHRGGSALAGLYRNKKTGMVVLCGGGEWGEYGQPCIVLISEELHCSEIGEMHYYKLDSKYYGSNIDSDWERLPTGTKLIIEQEPSYVPPNS